MKLEFQNLKIETCAVIAYSVPTAIAHASSMIGRNWLTVGAAGGLGFGFFQCVGAEAFKKSFHLSTTPVRRIAAEFLGGAFACGVSYAALHTGWVLAPVTIPTAIVLTVGVVAFKYLLGPALEAGLQALDNHIKAIEAEHKKYAKKNSDV